MGEEGEKVGEADPSLWFETFRYPQYVLDCFSSWMSLGDVGGSIKMLAG